MTSSISGLAARMLSKVRIPFRRLTIEIFVFACGHGDTILLHLPGDKWVLVDCNLQKLNGTRKKFFDFLESRNIQRLSYIFQTHPDKDHFCGMDDVLRHFTKDGRSVGYYCDGGLDTKQVLNLLQLGSGAKAYKRLHDILDDLDDRHLIDFDEMSEGHEDIKIEGFEDNVRLIPLAPNPGDKRRIQCSELKKVAQNPNLKTVSNELSIVLVLTGRRGRKTFNALLAADTGTKQLQKALKVWESKESGPESKGEFDAIKVPHHGSIASHLTALCKRKPSDSNTRVAAISAGTRPGLPDRQVIKDYLKHDWTVLLTNKPKAASRRRSPLELINRSQQRVPDASSNDIKITWTPLGGMKWEPLEARIDSSEWSLFKSLHK